MSIIAETRIAPPVNSFRMLMIRSEINENIHVMGCFYDMARHTIDNGYCALCENIYGTSVDEIRNTLLVGIWHYMSSKPLGDTRNVKCHDLPWMLAGCSLTGCRETLRFLLHNIHKIEHQSKDCRKTCCCPISSTTTKLDHLINQSCVCDFPLPDTWLHRTLRLALSPLHLACWRLDFPMIRTLLHLGADPNALALEHVDEEEYVEMKKVNLKTSYGKKHNSISHSDNCSRREMCDISSANGAACPRDNSPCSQSDHNKSTMISQPQIIDTSAFVTNRNTPVLQDKEKGILLQADKEISRSNSSSCVDGGEAGGSGKPCGVHQDSVILVDGEYFHSNRGLSPLALIALGVRSPPMYSIQLASQHGVVHDAQHNNMQKNTCSDCCELICFDTDRDSEDCVICNIFLLSISEGNSQLPSLSSPPLLSSSLSSQEVTSLSSSIHSKNKNELIMKCIDILIFTGADPNQGVSRFFNCALPLDIVIQPSIKVFYSSNMARSTQSSVSLRRSNLQAYLPQIIRSCRALISHNARVSPSFLSLYSWKPHLLDCFTVNPSQHSLDLVRTLMQLGIFNDENSTRTNYNKKVASDLTGVTNNQDGDADFDNGGVQASLLNKNMQTFIAGSANAEVPEEFLSIVFEWFSIPTLCVFRTISSGIIDASSFDNSHLRKLIQMSTNGQLRSLVHSSMLVILKSTNAKYFSYNRVQSLPIPAPLKRRLLYLWF